jgi:hypothetical protein
MTYVKMNTHKAGNDLSHTRMSRVIQIRDDGHTRYKREEGVKRAHPDISFSRSGGAFGNYRAAYINVKKMIKQIGNHNAHNATTAVCILLCGGIFNGANLHLSISLSSPHAKWRRND